ncbi:MAG: hypothetical protein HPY44_15455 [Armatimonadetes bacterium]|nr:hypothetical protein [Armatimonadota bacterium]
MACLAALSGRTGVAAEGELRTDVVAVVFSAAGAGRFSITVSYPTTVSREQAEADLATMQQATGWRFAAPEVTTEQGLTQVSAILFDSPSAKGSPVWPVVLALKRYNRVTVLLAGIGGTGIEGDINGKFVRGTWSGGGGVWCCDLTVVDRSFHSMEELRRGAGQQVSGNSSEPLQRRRSWVILAVFAVLVGALCYVIIARRSRA